ncbi:Fructose-2,6-bisphosphatase [Tieghemiomyces parasiticus]|uniref:Fructose-2,6-bisphosphatase n=1 Tax=Tieghemiomyces parasiticus TaxID=78921 RepID=A0A9W8DQ03_9FUNG|nr:Fructose-2,6-bisphosphatase [Tieghemiomyces parasiticus]
MSTPDSPGSGVPGTYIQRSALAPVGLPARGKSYIVKKLKRYLNWLGFSTKIFNVGNRRRTMASTADPNHNEPNHSSKFFDPDNSQAKAVRDQLAMDSLDELIHWLNHGDGHVAIHDATNSTRNRRRLILDRCEREPNLSVLFVESICDDQSVIRHNVRMKLLSPDYIGMDPGDARRDFLLRLRNYERAYQTIGPWEERREAQYCKIINVGKKIIAYNVQGYVAGQCVFYLMNMNLARRQIWITRHGESLDNLSGRIGGDAPLSEKGRIYAEALKCFIQEQRLRFEASLLTSTNSPMVAGSDGTPPHDLPPLPPASLAQVNESLLAHTSGGRTAVAGVDAKPALGKALDAVPVLVSSSSESSTAASPRLAAVPASTVKSGALPIPIPHTNGHGPLPTTALAVTTGSLELPEVSRSSSLMSGRPLRPPRFTVWTSMLQRTIQTVEPFDASQYDVKHIRSLNEIYAGACEGMTYREIEAKYPAEFAARQADKLYYRYPGNGGESYADVIQRLHPLIVELERTTHSALIVTHNAMTRTLLAYMLDIPTTEMTRMEVPLHTVYCLEPKPFGNECRRYSFNFEARQFELLDNTEQSCRP